jgi:hypothetical protein
VFDRLSVTAGFRWSNPSDQDLGIRDKDSPPFFVGAELPMAMTPWLDLNVSFDREFTDEPRWVTRGYVSMHPWRR